MIAVVIIAGIIYALFSLSSSKTDQAITGKEDYIEMTGLEIAEKNLEFIESMKDTGGNYYSFRECVNKECVNKKANSEKHFIQLRNDAFILYVKSLKDSGYKNELKNKLIEINELYKSSPQDVNEFVLAPLIEILINYNGNDDIYIELKNVVIEILDKRTLLYIEGTEDGDQYVPISFEEKEIEYYYDEKPPLPAMQGTINDMNYDEALKKSKLDQYGRRALAYIGAFELTGDTKYEYAARSVMTYANKWYANINQEVKADAKGVFKQESCFLILDHVKLYKLTGNEAYLEFPSMFFEEVDFNNVYSLNFIDNPEYINDLYSMIPCIKAFELMDKPEYGKAITYYLENSFDYPNLKGYIEGDGAFQTIYKDHSKKETYENIQISLLLMNSNNRFRIKKAN
ncbi:hypothetical protein JXB41_08765 [Candidatus Woesearchaeota archaeon]|nr:hypothetical protein [Candidatus Woesearchaeota archaeon]